MSAAFLRLFDDLTAAVREEDGSTFHQRFGQIWVQAQTVGPDDLTAGIELLAPVLAGALVERGGWPPVARVVHASGLTAPAARLGSASRSGNGEPVDAG